MTKVFITRRLPGIARNMLVDAGHEVEERATNEPCPSDELIRSVVTCDAVLSTVSDQLNEGVLRQRGRLQVISNYAVGLDNIDTTYARAAGIAVYNTPDVVTESTADMTFAILLALIRKIPAAQDFVREGHWKAWDPELFLGEELSGKVFGILGFGRVGQAVARRAIGFGLHVLYYDRPAKRVPPVFSHDPKAVSLEELFQQSDYLSIHLPLTEETRGMINARAIDAMQRKPIIVNMARGGIVVTDDLVSGLKSGKIRGAGLDVISPDRISGDHPLCQHDNVVVVPHIGTATVECRTNMAELAAKNIIRHFG